MIDQICDLIKEANSILIITHQSPDGDALGSSAGLFFALNSLGKKVRLICKDKIPETFLFIPGSTLFQRSFLMGDGELMILVDCGDLRRTGFPERVKKYAQTNKTLINIDHHGKNDLIKIANFNLSEKDSASSSQIIYKIIKKLGTQLTKDIATCLLAGAYFDTGGFRHVNTTSEVFNFASLMTENGANIKDLPRIDNKHRLSSLKLWGYALEKIIFENNIATVIITKKDLEKMKASEKDILGFANVLAEMDGVKIAFVLWETLEGLRGMLRTRQKEISVAHLAKHLGGGGFKNSAGFVLKAKLNLHDGRWSIVF